MREGFYIGPLFVHYYGVIIMIGVLAATWIATRQAKLFGMDPEQAWDMLPWVLIGGIIGARLWHVLTPPDSMIEQGITTQYYLTHPLDAIAIWKGGLGIPGAVAGGALAVYILSRKRKMSFLAWTDAVAPGLVLAQAIGRWGNFVNQELYGKPTDLPWAIFIEPAYRLPEFANEGYYHPLFLYESLWNILTMGILLWISHRYLKKLKKGYIFQIYLILYPVARFLLEFLRLDASSVAGINANQTLMAVIALSSMGILLWRIYKRPADIGYNEKPEPEREDAE